MSKTIERTKLREVVAEHLKAYIVEKNLKTGDRLPTESELAEMFGVSRLSLREATKSLEFLGIVEARPRRGMTVGSVNMERVTEYLGFHPVLHDVPRDQLIGTRIIIETGVTPYVAARMKENPSLYEKLNDLNTQMRETRSLQHWTELDTAFHRELVMASGMKPLLPFSDLLAVFFQQFRDSVKKAEWSVGLNDHQFIIDSLRDGNSQAASERLRGHIDSHRNRA